MAAGNFFLTLHDHRIWFACVIVWGGFFAPHTSMAIHLCVFDSILMILPLRGPWESEGNTHFCSNVIKKPTTTLIFTLFGFWTWSTKGGHRALVKCTTAGFSSMSLAHLYPTHYRFCRSLRTFQNAAHYLDWGMRIWKLAFSKGQMQENKYSSLAFIFFVYALFLNEMNEILEIEI